jgi:hypothetical protein
MNLSTFPHAIATASYKLLELGTKQRNLKSAILDIESTIDSAIAFGDCKNDTQRKAAKAQMLKEHEYYGEFTARLQELSDDSTRAEIKLNLIKNNFTIAKLEARERIAKLETLTT